MFEQFSSHKREEHFGVNHLFFFVKRDKDIPEDQLKKYALICDIQSPNGKGKYFTQKHFDALFNFCLLYEENLIASLGFDIFPDRITIKQIQGISGELNLLKDIKWEKSLINYTASFASQFEIQNIIIMPAEYNSFVQRGFLDYNKARMRYNGNARGCKFEKVKDLYVLKI